MLSRFIIYLIYGVPSAILNLLLIICILRNKQLLINSFYRVYVFVLIVYLATHVNTWITLKPKELPSTVSFYTNISTNIPPFRFFYMWQCSAFHVEQLALILLHLNRFTSVWLPILHFKIWRRSNFRLAVLGVFLLGFGFNYQILFLTGYYIPVDEGYAATDRATQAPISLWAEKTLMHVYPLLSLIINLATISKVLYRRCIGKGFGKHTIELNLLFICLANLFVQLGLMFWVDWGRLLFDPTAQLLVHNLASDGTTLVEAYIGLIMNGSLRRGFLSSILPSSFKIDFQSSTSQSIYLVPKK